MNVSHPKPNLTPPKNDKTWIEILLGPIIQKVYSFQSICSSGLAVCCPRHIEADGILVPKKTTHDLIAIL